MKQGGESRDDPSELAKAYLIQREVLWVEVRNKALVPESCHQRLVLREFLSEEQLKAQTSAMAPADGRGSPPRLNLPATPEPFRPSGVLLSSNAGQKSAGKP